MTAREGSGILVDMSRPPEIPLPMPAQTFLWIRHPTLVMKTCKQRYGSTFTLRLPGLSVTLFSDPPDIRTIFAAKPDDMHAGKVNVILRALVGESSVLLLDGAEHMQRRKLLLPSFHGDRMRFYGETIADATRDVAAHFSRTDAFALHPHTQEITLQVILRAVFGAEDATERDTLRRQLLRTLRRANSSFAFLPLLYLSTRPEADEQRPWKWMLRELRRTDEMLYQTIARRRQTASQTDQDILSTLLRARDENGAGLSDREVRDELFTALVAGHETTATALAWTFERILNHRNVYARMCEEVRALGSSPAPAQLAGLPYMDAVIKEVLRLRPVIPLVGRALQKPHTIGGYSLPAGTRVGACIYLAHRNPEVYPDPETFNPERFLNMTPDPASWLPFGGGIRRCIGASFALYEMKIVLGTLLSMYDFELAQKGSAKVVRRAITFVPDGGTMVRARMAA